MRAGSSSRATATLLRSVIPQQPTIVLIVWRFISFAQTVRAFAASRRTRTLTDTLHGELAPLSRVRFAHITRFRRRSAVRCRGPNRGPGSARLLASRTEPDDLDARKRSSEWDLARAGGT